MSATSRVSWLGVIGRGSGLARKLGGVESPMGEFSHSLNDMRARSAAGPELSRTNGSMPSTLHDTREFMLSSGLDFGAPPAPSASPRVPEKRQSNSAQVVCLWHRLFRVTVNNRLRNRAAGPESCRPDEIDRVSVAATANGAGQVVAMAALTCLGLLEPSKVHSGTQRLLRCKIP